MKSVPFAAKLDTKLSYWFITSERTRDGDSSLRGFLGHLHVERYELTPLGNPIWVLGILVEVFIIDR